MEKTYLRYVHEAAFGVIASSRAPTIADATGQVAFAPAVHEVLAWDLRRGTKLRTMTPDGESALRGEVTAAVLGPATRGGGASGSGRLRHLVAGYTTGVVRVFDAAKGGESEVSGVRWGGQAGQGPDKRRWRAPTVPPSSVPLTPPTHTSAPPSSQITLVGHKGTVQCLCVAASGMVLASGGADTDIVLWDLVAERGLFRLKGHKDAITAVKFVGGGAGGLGGEGAGEEQLGGAAVDATLPRALISSSRGI